MSALLPAQQGNCIWAAPALHYSITYSQNIIMENFIYALKTRIKNAPNKNMLNKYVHPWNGWDWSGMVSPYFNLHDLKNINLLCKHYLLIIQPIAVFVQKIFCKRLVLEARINIRGRAVISLKMMLNSI